MAAGSNSVGSVPVFNVAGTRVGIQVIPQNSVGPGGVVPGSISGHPLVRQRVARPLLYTDGQGVTRPQSSTTAATHPEWAPPPTTTNGSTPQATKQLKFAYKVKVIDPTKRSKFVVRQLHHFSGKFKSVNEVRSVLSAELSEVVPDEDSDYSVGYFEGRQQTKRWLVSSEDLQVMYQLYKEGEIFLWSDGKEETVDKRSEEDVAKRKNRKSESAVRARRDREEDFESLYSELQKKHGDSYSGPQLRLWARMIMAGTHDNKDEPPRVPMITGQVPKRQKQDSLSDALAGMATAFASAFRGTPVQSVHSPPSSSVGISPGKTADIRMKNLQQLRFLQQLMEDRIISEQEFVEQKSIVLETLRNLG